MNSEPVRIIRLNWPNDDKTWRVLKIITKDRAAGDEMIANLGNLKEN